MFLLEKLAYWAKTDRTAIVYGETQVSYRTLARQSDAFAAYLKRRFGDDKTPILIYGHKEVEIPACMFGALKAGHGYIPVDTTFPVERVAQITAEAKPRLAVDLYKIGVEAETVLDGAALADILAQDAPEAPASDWVRPDDVAYILFTSGSTGKPKGVQITAGNIAAFNAGAEPWLQVAADGGTILNEISYSFDVSVCALYFALSRGMRLYTIDRAALNDTKALFAALRHSDAALWVSTPSLAEICMLSGQFEKALLPNTERFVLCGEVLTKKLAAGLIERFPGAKILNAYGPTETTVLVTATEVTAEMCRDGRSIPIGFAFSNLTARIVSPEGTDLPDGSEGELLIEGACVSPGYLGRPDLNEKSFYTAENGVRGYHTGDLCRREADGQIYYFGRLDGQIKLNGFRVELEDVENNLVRVDNVARAAVVPVKQEGKVVSLTAFVMLQQPDGLPSLQRQKKIKAQLAETLPPYMIPRKILVVESFPTNTNGKVDKKVLAEKA